MRLLDNARFSAVIIATMLGLMLAAGCQQPDASAALKPLLDAYIEAWNTGNVDGLDAVMDSQFVRHADPSAQSSAEGLEALKSVITSARKTFPDFHVTMDEEIYVGNKAVGRWTFTATHSGAGNAALAGKQVKSSGISVVHVAGGKMVEEWAAWDNLNNMQQLGFTITPPDTAEMAPDTNEE